MYLNPKCLIRYRFLLKLQKTVIKYTKSISNFLKGFLLEFGEIYTLMRYRTMIKGPC